MKLSICLTVALTAICVAAAPSLDLQERGSFGAANGISKIKLKVSPQPPRVNPASYRPSRKPSRQPLYKPFRIAPHQSLRPPVLRPQVRLPAQNRPGSKQNGPGGFQNGIGGFPNQPRPPVQNRPAPPRPRPPPPQSRPAVPPPRARPRPQSNSDPLSTIGNVIGDVAGELIPHFDLGGLFRRNRDYYNR